jgi:hypothetical protein
VNILLGIVAIVVGALIAAYGTRGFYLLLPLFGFVMGFLLGAQVVTALVGDGVFATALSWVAGFVVAVAFAALAGLFWWAAVVILFAVVGFDIGSGVLVAFGWLDPGVVTWLLGIVVAAVFAVAALVLDAPTLFVAAVTAFGGAAYAVAGFFLLFGQITTDALKDGPLGSLAGHEIGLLFWLGLGVIAFLFQYADTRRIGFEAIDRGRYRFA